jgi:hypothetical protein
MEWKKYNMDMEHNILMKIKEGMKVYDSRDHEIGKVDDVFLGSVTPKDEDIGEGPATTGTVVPGTTTQSPKVQVPGQLQNLDDHETPNFGFGGSVNPTNTGEDDRDRILDDRMLREGYVRVDAKGLFSRDVIVRPEQIASVQEDVVHLNVPDEDLPKV